MAIEGCERFVADWSAEGYVVGGRFAHADGIGFANGGRSTHKYLPGSCMMEPGRAHLITPFLQGQTRRVRGVPCFRLALYFLMAMRKRSWICFVPYFLSLAVFLVAAAATPAQDAAWQKEIKEFRENRAAGLQKPDGWLSLVGLEWLQPGDASVGSAPDNKVKLSAMHPAHLGIFRLENNVVTLLPPKEGFPAGLTVGGSAAKTVDTPRSLTRQRRVTILEALISWTFSSDWRLPILFRKRLALWPAAEHRKCEN